MKNADALLTSGGAWLSKRDLVIDVLEESGWEKIFHRVRLGPGKGVGFGLLQSKPVFCLPGGPPSNETAFLLVALPGLLRMAGYPSPGFETIRAKLGSGVQGQEGWTKVFRGRIETGRDTPTFTPAFSKSRLSAMAETQALLVLAEDTPALPAGHEVSVQVLTTTFGSESI